MESKSKQTFRQRLEYSKQYLQTVYGTLQFVSKELKGKPKEDKICDYIGKSFKVLNQPITQVERIFNYSKMNICKYYIIELYRAFDEYLRNCIREVFSNKSEKVLGLCEKSLSFTGAEIVKLKNYENICDNLVAKIYRELESSQSTKKLLDKFIKTFKLSIEKDVETNALAVLELRHLIIHNNSLIDNKYQVSFPKMKLKTDDKIPTRFNIVASLEKKLIPLIDNIDKELIKGKLVNAIS